MTNNLEDAIQQADRLIKEGDYRHAWGKLLPYKHDSKVRTRLLWLNQQLQQQANTPSVQSNRPRSRSRSILYFTASLFGILGISLVIIKGLSREGGTLPIATHMASDAAAMVTATPLPTEHPQEVALQQQLRDWFTTVDGVGKVWSLDIDMPDDEQPLVYAEIDVTSGFNDIRIPNIFAAKLNDTFGTAQYADFVIILNDGSRTVEYTFDSENSTWLETEI